MAPSAHPTNSPAIGAGVNYRVRLLSSRAPSVDGSSPVVIYVYVDNVDSVVERAVAAGAKVLVPIQDQFWGDRTGRIIDPAGHVWIVSSRIEETTENQRRERWSNIASTKG